MHWEIRIKQNTFRNNASEVNFSRCVNYIPRSVFTRLIQLLIQAAKLLKCTFIIKGAASEQNHNDPQKNATINHV